MEALPSREEEIWREVESLVDLKQPKHYAAANHPSDATEESDIDLLLVLRGQVGITRNLYADWAAFCRQHAGAWDRERVSPHFVALPASVRQAGGLWYETALDGIVLWERDKELSRFLRSVRIAMGQGSIRRRVVHGSPYWTKNFEKTDA